MTLALTARTGPTGKGGNGSGHDAFAKVSTDDRSYEGFRMPALTRAEGLGRRAGVRKPQGEETAGR